MSAIFEDALYLSFVISIFILLLLGFSKMTESKYTPKWRYWTWLFVSLRLAVPFVPEHTINLSHLLPELTPLSYDTEYLTEGSIIAAQTHSLPESNENVISTLLPIQSLNAMEIVVTVWIIGVICFICYHLIGYILFRKKMRRWSEKLIDINLISIFQDMMNEMKIHRKIDLVINKNVTSPMIIGFFKVTLMLPDQVYEAADLFPILKHELVHVKRRDAWYKLILIYINALYWFNPITYLMVYVANRDLEICCDDDVVSGKPIEFREMYSKTILSAAQQKEYSFYPSNFNGGIQMVKMRLKNILNMKPRKKGIFVLILVALALCILGTKITATNAAAKSFTWNTSENITVIDKSLKNSTLKDYKYYETLSLNFSAKDGYKRVEQYCTNVLGNINDSNSLLYVNPSSENQADIAYVINQSDKSEYSISEVNFSDAENIVISHVGSFTPLSTSSIDACLKAMTAKKDRILAIANSFNIDLSSYYEVSPGYSPEFNQYNLYSLRGEINIEQGGTTPAFFLNKEHSEGIILLSDAQGKEYLYKNHMSMDGHPNAEPEVQTAPAPEAAANMLPDAPELTLDEYPLPDSELTVADLEACGYLDGDLLPLSKDRALELFEQDLTIYMIEDGGASMAFGLDEIQFHSGLLAMSREEWEGSREFSEAIEDRMKHQEQREAAFLKTSQDAFAIYQVKGSDELRDIRFEPLSWLESKGVSVDHGNYDLAYTAPLTYQGNTDDRLAVLWDRFNNDHPADYHRPSLSVSDIVALKQNGVVSCHYADSFGFQELPAFLKPENYLKNAEMAMEDDYGMVDGIINNGPKATVAELEQQAKNGQPISLLELAEASRREHDEKKKFVVERLRNQPVSRGHKKTAPDKDAEMER